MAKKLTSAQLFELSEILGLIGVPHPVKATALSLSNQVRVYHQYKARKDCFVKPNNSQPVNISFSRIDADVDMTLSGQEIVRLGEQERKNFPEPQDSSILVFEPQTKTKPSKSSFTVRLNDTERKRLQQIADNSDIPLAQVLRTAVKFYLKQHPNCNVM